MELMIVLTESFGFDKISLLLNHCLTYKHYTTSDEFIIAQAMKQLANMKQLAILNCMAQLQKLFSDVITMQKFL